jgi:hypothetical protein
MLLKAPKEQFSDLDFLGLLAILGPSLHTAILVKRNPTELIFILDLLILIVSTMVDVGFKGIGIEHPLTHVLDKLIGEPGPLDEIIKYKAAYALNLLTAFEGRQQQWQESLTRYRAAGEGLLNLLALATSIAACVAMPVTIPVMLPGMIGSAVGAYNNLEQVNKKSKKYDVQLRKLVEFLRCSAWALHENSKQIHFNKFTDLLESNLDCEKPYITPKGAAPIITLVIIEIITLSLLLYKTPMAGITKNDSRIDSLFKLLMLLNTKKRLKNVKVYLCYCYHKLSKTAFDPKIKRDAEAALRNIPTLPGEPPPPLVATLLQSPMTYTEHMDHTIEGDSI